MKIFILIFAIFFFSCNRKANDVKNIEIMKYRKDFDSNFDPIFRPLQYSYIDSNGIIRVINYSKIGKDDKFISYKISKQRLKIISTNAFNHDDEYFRLKEKDFTNEIYCGLDEFTRYRIKFENGKSVSFVLLNHNIKIKKYSELLIGDFDLNAESKHRISDSDTLNLINLKNEFENFVTEFDGQQLYPIAFQKVKLVLSKK